MVLYNSSPRLRVSINLVDVVDSSQCNIFLMSHPVDEIGPQERKHGCKPAMAGCRTISMNSRNPHNETGEQDGSVIKMFSHNKYLSTCRNVMKM